MRRKREAFGYQKECFQLMNNQINRKILITKITCKHNRLRRLVGPRDSSLKHAKHYFHWLQETDTHSSVMGSLLGGCSSSSEPMLTSVCLSVCLSPFPGVSAFSWTLPLNCPRQRQSDRARQLAFSRSFSVKQPLAPAGPIQTAEFVLLKAWSFHKPWKKGC